MDHGKKILKLFSARLGPFETIRPGKCSSRSNAPTIFKDFGSFRHGKKFSPFFHFSKGALFLILS